MDALTSMRRMNRGVGSSCWALFNCSENVSSVHVDLEESV